MKKMSGIVCDRCKKFVADGQPFITVKGKKRELQYCSEECKLGVVKKTPVKKVQNHHHEFVEPKTQWEAVKMIAKIWAWLFKKNPIPVGLVTLWMCFGGGYYLYNYLSSDKVSIKDAIPLGQTTEFSIMPKAFAGDKNIPIVFDNKLWGYEDTTYVAKVDNTRPIILVYNKVTHEVKQVEFDTNFKMKFMQMKK